MGGDEVTGADRSMAELAGQVGQLEAIIGVMLEVMTPEQFAVVREKLAARDLSLPW